VPVPLFDTATPLAPLRERIHAKLAEIADGGRYILGPEVEAFEREFAPISVRATRSASPTAPTR
jgi:hypothetical protein